MILVHNQFSSNREIQQHHSLVESKKLQWAKEKGAQTYRPRNQPKKSIKAFFLSRNNESVIHLSGEHKIYANGLFLGSNDFRFDKKKVDKVLHASLYIIFNGYF
jgi:hypothetical protein